jgi:hypothetical protein
MDSGGEEQAAALCPDAGHGGRKDFFFEKKKQKTFTASVRASRNARARVQKFFGSFFQKRTASLLKAPVLSCPTRNSPSLAPA